jgi:hypothetical protein
VEELFDLKIDVVGDLTPGMMVVALSVMIRVPSGPMTICGLTLIDLGDCGSVASDQ